MADRAQQFVEQHRRKALWILAVVGLYAVLGFWLAPWMVKKNAIDTVQATYGADLRIEKVAINPFVLDLRIESLAMDDPDGDAVLRLDEFYANFQLSSLFHWALTFAEVRFDSPEIFVARESIGDMNLAFLWENGSGGDGDAAQGDSTVPRFVLQELSVNDASAHWDDAVPREPVKTVFGPVNVQVQDLSTLPQREGSQDVVITTETTGTFSWSGSLQLNPLRSTGHASIEGSHFPLLSAYIRDNTGFEVIRGDSGVELDYEIDTTDDGQLQVRVDNIELNFADLMLRTFGMVASDGSSSDREIIEIPHVGIHGGRLRFPEREVSIESVGIADGVLRLHREVSGKFSFLQHLESIRDSDVEVVEADEASSAPGWAVSLDKLDVERTSIHLTDDSVSPTAEISVNNIDVGVADISNLSGAQFPLEVSLETGSGGSVSLSGAVGILPAPQADLEVVAEGISLAVLHPYIKSLADVNLDSGALGASVTLRTGPEETLAVSGNAGISDFLITETDEGSRLGSWDLLAANQFALSLSDETLEISEIQFDRPYGDILIAADGSVNLGRVAPGKQSAEQATDDETAADTSHTAASRELPLAVTIGRVLINDGAADFADRSLPLPFDVSIAELNGDLTTIASASSEPSEAQLEGKVDEFGLVQVSGTITPLQPALNTDLKVNFENVAMPKFSAYSVPFAGREIASGKLDLALGYKLEASELVGENKIVLRDFELGDEVDHPGASSLPLGLAVALLKDADGTIDIDLPVRGNVDDPEFRYGSVVGKALVNLVVKIVASPFALLGNLVGAEADELEFIVFQDGRSDLTPPEQEKAAKLAEALSLRPELSMQIDGVIDRDADGLALQTMRLDDFVDDRITALGLEEGAESSYADQKRRILEENFNETELGAIQARFTSEDVLDELAYTNELRRQQIAAQNLAEIDFVALSSARAANVRAAIVAAYPELDSQIVIGSLAEVTKDSDDGIQMQVVLTAGDDSG